MNKLIVSMFAAAICFGAASSPAQTTASAGLLRDADGRTLYTFDKDGTGVSHCFDACATAWPPFMAGESAKADGKLAPVPRQGGGQQWALDGKPLYYFAGDIQPGDAKGDGSGGVWHVARLRAALESRAKATKTPDDPYKY